jgi:hypothetical protein
MSKASFEIAGIKFTDVDIGGHGISTVKYPSQDEVAAYERGRAAGRAEERADIVAWLRDRAGKANEQAESALTAGKRRDWVELLVHSVECFETAAFGIETGARAKAPTKRQEGGGRA